MDNTAYDESGLPFDFDSFLATHKGGISPEEGLALSRYAGSIDNGDIVEIGSYRGKSAVALAHGLQAGPVTQTRIYCIEPHENFTGVYGGEFGARDRGEFYRIMLETGYYDRVSLINLKSAAAAKGWSAPIGLLFIDGDHTVEGVRQDAEAWESHVLPGGYVVFDDSTDPAIGPCRVVEELLATRRFELTERIGKITVLRKLSSQLTTVHQETRQLMRVLVICHDLIQSGGLLRFERIGRELRNWGHELCFATVSEHPAPAWHSEFPVLPIEEAARQDWTVTMVPGAGFPDETINRFAHLQAGNFGYRVQHVLNDPSLRSRFLAVNRTFAPDLVVFNNSHWTPGSYTDFQARKFAVLPGAVDTGRFAPAPYRPTLAVRESIIIGGLANKNPAPLIEALRLLPDHFVVQLYGTYSGDYTGIGELLDSGRLQLVGRLDEDALPGFYAAVDIVVHTEAFAGWANLAAEAMASGVPLICTAHGTTSFAADRKTALVLDEVDAPGIVEGVQSRCADPDATAAMVTRARARMLQYDWSVYTACLAELCRDDGKCHYTLAPELGLYGKWPLADRYKDLDYIFDNCSEKTVIDFGCAEGVIALRCLEQGARMVHGLELEESRVNTAAGLCAGYPESHFFFHANLDDWQEIRDLASQVLLPQYDIVLYLGIQHHLACPQRLATLADAISMAGHIFAIRTTADVYHEDDIEARLSDAGFEEFVFEKTDQRDGFGVARIFVRR